MEADSTVGKRGNSPGRATVSRHHGTPFWRHVIQVLPRGAWVDAQDPQFMHFTLEGSLWMLYYEVLTHLYTIQRLKRAQGLCRRGVFCHGWAI